VCECGSECEGSVTSRTSTEAAWRGRGRHEKGRWDEGALSGYMAFVVVLAGGQAVDARDSRLPCRASRGAYPRMSRRIHHVHHPGRPSSAKHVRQSSPFPIPDPFPPRARQAARGITVALTCRPEREANRPCSPTASLHAHSSSHHQRKPTTPQDPPSLALASDPAIGAAATHSAVSISDRVFNAQRS
jgi:hypothetical protein